MKITYYGHSAFGIQCPNGMRVLIDPFITGNPLAPVQMEDMQADFIIVTHAHGDHVGDALQIADRTKAEIITVTELGYIIEPKGYKVHGMQIGGACDYPFGRVKFTMALHGSRTDEGEYAGLASGALITCGDTTIYHTGDTGIFYDMKLIGEMNKIDYMLLPIGGFYTMDIADAVKAVELARPRIAIPMHYDTFPIISADPHEFCKRVKEKGFDCIVMKPGASI